MTNQAEWITSTEATPDFQFDYLMVAVGEAIAARMAEMELTGAALADRLGVSRARVSQILSGADNLTLKSLVTVATALGLEVHIDFRRPRSEALPRWNPASWKEPGVFRPRSATIPRTDAALAA